MKMPESPFHTNALNVSAFLGGTTFAAMILIIEMKDRIGFHPNWLISGTAAISVFFIISTVGMMRVASGDVGKETAFAKSMEWFSNIGFFGLLAIIPTLIYQFSQLGGIVVGAIVLMLIAILGIFRIKGA